MGGTAQTLRRGPRAEPPRAENSVQTRLLCILGALIALVVAYLIGESAGNARCSF